jgi:UDP-glucose 4-epimerase
MRVCVTGASGFIGRYVVKALQSAGHEVIGLDLGNPTTKSWIDANITTPLPKITDLDAVIHLAAVANPRECDTNPTKAFDVNVNGTHQVLKMALDSGAKKVVFASSAHVYGISPKYLPTDECHPLWLQNNYTLTKILGEQLCQLYYDNHGLSYTALRLYNSYGPGQVEGYFIPDMLSKAQKGSIELPGGNTTKDWVYVEETARAFLLALETPFIGSINIGSGSETDLTTIAKYIADATGASFSSTSSANATRMQADNSRARRVLDWTATVGISEGLERIFQHEGIKVVV